MQKVNIGSDVITFHAHINIPTVVKNAFPTLQKDKKKLSLKIKDHGLSITSETFNSKCCQRRLSVYISSSFWPVPVQYCLMKLDGKYFPWPRGKSTFSVKCLGNISVQLLGGIDFLADHRLQHKISPECTKKIIFSLGYQIIENEM